MVIVEVPNDCKWQSYIAFEWVNNVKGFSTVSNLSWDGKVLHQDLFKPLFCQLSTLCCDVYRGSGSICVAWFIRHLLMDV